MKNDQYYSDIYNVLCESAGAAREDLETFIISHRNGCTEYRFIGFLGFGGKYRSITNTIDCYKEDLNKDRQLIIEKTNKALKEVIWQPVQDK